jgi:hypothetical protein
VTTNATERFAQLIDLDSPPVFLDGGDPAMRPSVALTAALRHAGTASAPTPMASSTKLAMREQLVAAATAAPAAEAMPGVAARVVEALESGERRAAKAGRKISRRITTLVGSVVLVTSVAGVGVAAARSLPGSPFYDLKRATEAVQLWATSGEAAKGQRHLEFAQTRIAEASHLPANSPYLASTLKAMNNEIREANTDLVKEYHATGNVAPLADLVRFARTQANELATVAAKLPASLHQDAAYSATLLTGVTQEIRSLTIGVCQQCATSPAPSTRTGPTLAPSATPSTHPSGTHATSKPSTKPTQSPSTAPNASASTNPLRNLFPTLPPLLGNKVNPLPSLTPLPLLSSLAQLLEGK